MSKVHIGMILNLDRETDATINNILSNLPSYESKSKYLRQAVLFYEKYRNNGAEINAPATPIPAVNQSQQTSLDSNELLTTIRLLAKSLEDMKKDITDLKEGKEDDTLSGSNNDNKTASTSHKKNKQSQPKPQKDNRDNKVANTPKETVEESIKTEEPKANKPDDVIEISNSTKAGSVSYAEFMGDFLS